LRRRFPRADAVAPSVDGLLGIKGVIEVVEPESDEAEMQAARAAVSASFEQALQSLIDMRKRAACALGQILSQRMDEMVRLAQRAKPHPDASRKRSAPGWPNRSRHCLKRPIVSTPTGSVRKR
jgi:uncharacterized protein YicC (UPF0701 family)